MVTTTASEPEVGAAPLASDTAPSDTAPSDTSPSDTFPSASEPPTASSLLNLLGMFLNSGMPIEPTLNSTPSDSEEEEDRSNGDFQEKSSDELKDPESSSEEESLEGAETEEGDQESDGAGLETSRETEGDRETARVWFTLCTLQSDLRNSAATNADFWHCLLYPFVRRYFPQFTPQQTSEFIGAMQQRDLNKAIEQVL